MKLLVILGPTAIGKTNLAVNIADRLEGELISADSRQVYKGMDIGTGKDLNEYQFNNKFIPYHLIDIKEAGEEYHLFDFQRDFYNAYREVSNKKKLPILCGGTGLYLDAALADKQMLAVPTNIELRNKLKNFSQEDLNEYLKQLKPNQHNTTDILQRERTIRAIEIAEHESNEDVRREPSPVKESIIFGLKIERAILRNRIEERLDERLSNGMIEEVEGLINKGLSHDKLHYYGLEYKFISSYLLQQISYEDMHRLLLQAIRRFAKKQMTWFRRMEKLGKTIYWIDASLALEEKIAIIQDKLS